MSAFNGSGLLEGTATAGQEAQRPFTLNLKGRAVPANVLQNWGWPALPLSGSSNSAAAEGLAQRGRTVAYQRRRQFVGDDGYAVAAADDAWRAGAVMIA